MNFIQRVGAEHEEVRATLRVLEGLVVGKNGYIILTIGLIAPKHVQVSAIHLSLACYEWRFAVAGSKRRWNCQHRNSQTHASLTNSVNHV